MSPIILPYHIASGADFHCHTKNVGAFQPTSVAHIWFYDYELKTGVYLNVKSYSRAHGARKKCKIAGLAGKWWVDVVSSEGDLPASKEFTVGPNLE